MGNLFTKQKKKKKLIVCQHTLCGVMYLDHPCNPCFVNPLQ